MNRPDSTKSIFQSASRFFGGTMISRISGLCRDMAIAFAFGTHSALAAFMVAFRLAHLLRRLLGEGALQSAFIPKFEDLKNEDPTRACRFFGNLYGLIIFVLMLLIPCCIAALFCLIFFVELSPGNKEIAELTIVMLPSLFFISLYGLNASLLQCERSYFTPSVAPTIFNVIWIIGVVLVKNLPEDSAMIYLGVFIILASAGQWIMTIPAVYKALKTHGHTVSWRGVNFRDKDLWLIASPLLLGVFGVAASQINSFFDAIFARYASEEGPAYLWYAVRAQQLPLGLFAVSLSGALLPPLSRAGKEGDVQKFCSFLNSALMKTIMLMIPVTFGMLMIGDSAINLVYGRGSFTAESTVVTTVCLWGYAIGLLPTSLVLILAPAFYAQNRYKLTTLASTIAMLLNVVLNAVLVMGYGLGAFSVALATSVSAWIHFFILYIFLLRSFDAHLGRSYVACALRVFCVSLAASLFVYFVDTVFFGENTAMAIFNGKIPLYPRDFPVQALRFTTGAVAYVSGTAIAFLLNFTLNKVLQRPVLIPDVGDDA